jgi:hypothetical protein
LPEKSVQYCREKFYNLGPERKQAARTFLMAIVL